MIHKVENEYVISSHQVWVPGCYASKRAANYAFRFTDEELSSFGTQTITFEMLQNLRKQKVVV